jgi:single-strand DNA-binding protein
MNINRCEISGNVTRDGELKATPGGLQILTFGLAFNDRKRDANGDWQDVPNYIDCVCFGKYAESMAKHITKGRRVFVAGKLRYSQWTTEDGAKRSKIELVAETMDLPPTGQKQAQGAPQAEQAPTYSTPAQVAPEPIDPNLYDEDIPF